MLFNLTTFGIQKLAALINDLQEAFKKKPVPSVRVPLIQIHHPEKKAETRPQQSPNRSTVYCLLFCYTIPWLVGEPKFRAWLITRGESVCRFVKPKQLNMVWTLWGGLKTAHGNLAVYVNVLIWVRCREDEGNLEIEVKKHFPKTCLSKIIIIPRFAWDFGESRHYTKKKSYFF